MPPYIPNLTPSPTTILPWVVGFPLDDLDFRTKAITTRAPTRKTFAVFYGSPQRGIRVVYDPSVNDRLLEALNGNIQADMPVPDVELLQAEYSRRSAAGEEINSEADMSGVMRTNFFLSSNVAIRLGLPSGLHGIWKSCPNASDSGISDWVFVATGDTDPRAIIELKLPSMLTAAVNRELSGDSPVEDQEDLGEPSGDCPDEEQDGHEQEDTYQAIEAGKVHLSLKLEKLVS